ncbi:MAG: glycosyltransferase family A protein [Acidimicrobiales bacterium]
MQESDLVFNLVWTGGVYRYLRYFVFSLLDQTQCRFRFIANNCTPDSVREMQTFAAATDRIVEVVVLDVARMVPHGTALDPIFDGRDDGDLFCFIDVDIKATRPFLADFAAATATHDVVTSGVEVWTDVNTLAADEVGVGGRHFYAHDGFVFGSPHMAIYRKAIVRETFEKWGIRFHCGGKTEMSSAAWATLERMGKAYIAYDTAKVLNILLQADGHSLTHQEHDALVHIGGLSHYLAPPQFDFATDVTSGDIEGEPMWTTYGGVELRAAVARFTAMMLKELAAGRRAPSIPDGLDDDTTGKLELVRTEVITMVEDAAPWLELTGG